MSSGASVRTLAHPGFVLALVVLVLNDHVLKRAYPGVVTGKLSDVAGLVVAPLVLGVLLTAWRARRPMLSAIALTGIGFTLTKASVTGAAMASAVWSLAGVPTHIRADVTDLLALPALYGAWLVHNRARPTPDWRAALSRATGVAMVPVAVLATAATSCDDSGFGVDDLTVVSGQFAGPPSEPEARIVFGWDNKSVDETGHLGLLPRYDAYRLQTRSDDSAAGMRTCDEAGWCWRVSPETARTVEVSHDGGTRWQPEYTVPADEAKAAIEGVDDSCGNKPEVRLVDLAVLGSGENAVVAVAAQGGGLLLRAPDASWRLVTMDELEDLPDVPDPTPQEGFITPVPARPSDEETPGLPGGETPTSTPTCEEPVTVTATPNPQNGPPTVYTYCA